MMRRAVVLVGILSLAAGCATSSRATELRDQMRVRRGAKWSDAVNVGTTAALGVVLHQ